MESSTVRLITYNLPETLKSLISMKTCFLRKQFKRLEKRKGMLEISPKLALIARALCVQTLDLPEVLKNAVDAHRDLC
jgi:hypothetical protein